MAYGYYTVRTDRVIYCKHLSWLCTEQYSIVCRNSLSSRRFVCTPDTVRAVVEACVRGVGRKYWPNITDSYWYVAGIESITGLWISPPVVIWISPWYVYIQCRLGMCTGIGAWAAVLCHSMCIYMCWARFDVIVELWQNGVDTHVNIDYTSVVALKCLHNFESPHQRI